MIKINNVSKHFGDKIAVNNLQLTIEPGEIFAFLGPNGAGKTTTIKMMVGLLQPTSGNIDICGYNMQEAPLKGKEQIAYVPDQPYVYDKLTGREFLEFVGRMYDIEKQKLAQKIEELIELFELKDYIDNLCENYSHGMKQRIVFSSALIHDPRVMVIDEPMVGLDPKSSRIVKDVLRDQAKNNVAIFMSTHSLTVAEETATKIGIIKLGKMIALGSLSELRGERETEKRLEEIFLELTEESGG